MSRDVDSALPSKLALIGLRPWVAHMSSPLMRLLESQPLDSDSEVTTWIECYAKSTYAYPAE